MSTKAVGDTVKSAPVSEARVIVAQFHNGELSYWKAHVRLAGKFGIPHEEIADGLHRPVSAPHYVPPQFMKYLTQ